MTTLDSYPFLRAALEDVELAAKISSNEAGSARHAVILMHDAIEFILYELLLLLDQDIYANGQHTIGLDAALSQSRKLDVDIPLIGTIRSIQKHRGDAKHHAQCPQEDAFRRMLGEFRIVVSRLVHEQFGTALSSQLPGLGILPYHTALYESFRKYRTHNWNNALRFAVGALIFKHRAIVLKPADFVPCDLRNIDRLVHTLSSEITNSPYGPASESVIQQITGLPDQIAALLRDGNLAGAAELMGKSYSLVDGLVPSIFDISKARKLTDCLVLPAGFRFGRSMSWSLWKVGDTPKKQEANSRLQDLLKSNPQFVKNALGEPYYDDDGDRYWKWWELAVFDGERWHSFHLRDSFDLQLESGAITEDEAKQRERVAELICREFAEAIPIFALKA
jgi:hypothetical protein